MNLEKELKGKMKKLADLKEQAKNLEEEIKIDTDALIASGIGANGEILFEGENFIVKEKTTVKTSLKPEFLDVVKNNRELARDLANSGSLKIDTKVSSTKLLLPVIVKTENFEALKSVIVIDSGVKAVNKTIETVINDYQDDIDINEYVSKETTKDIIITEKEIGNDDVDCI